MSDGLFFVLELAVKPEQVEDLRSVMRDMVEIARTEPGTLSYEWFINDEGTVCHLYERYADAQAALVHGASFPNELNERSHAFPPVRLTAYGEVTKEIRENKIDPIGKVIPGFTAVFLKPLGGLGAELRGTPNELR